MCLAGSSFAAKIIPGDEWLWLLEPPGMESPSARASQGDTSSAHTPTQLCSSWAATQGPAGLGNHSRGGKAAPEGATALGKLPEGSGLSKG